MEARVLGDADDGSAAKNEDGELLDVDLGEPISEERRNRRRGTHVDFRALRERLQLGSRRETVGKKPLVLCYVSLLVFRLGKRILLKR